VSVPRELPPIRYEVRRADGKPSILPFYHSLLGATADVGFLVHNAIPARIVVCGTEEKLTALGARPIAVGAGSRLMVWLLGQDYECEVVQE
jgi:hypothetical protein